MNHYSIIGPSGTPVFEAECADIVPGCVCLGRILDLDAVPEALGLVYIGEFVDNQAIPSNQWGLFAMTDYHRFMPGPLRERLKKLK